MEGCMASGTRERLICKYAPGNERYMLRLLTEAKCRYAPRCVCADGDSPSPGWMVEQDYRALNSILKDNESATWF